jgi:hypothetical protein
VTFPVPTYADAERYVREKEAIAQYYGIMAKAQQIMRRAYEETPEGKAEAKRKLEAKAQREAELAESARKREAHAVRLAAMNAARKAKTEGEHERERRSRIKWAELIDDGYIVKRQIAWERRATALAMRNAGMTFTEIGDRFGGLSRGRAQQLVAHAERERSRPGRRSPAEAYFAEAPIAARDCTIGMRAAAAAIAPRDDDADWIWVGLAA